jgi:hypothetical protein
MLEAGRSRVRFPMKSLNFAIDLFIPGSLWLWGRLSLCQKWVPGIFLTPFPYSLISCRHGHGRKTQPLYCCMAQTTQKTRVTSQTASSLARYRHWAWFGLYRKQPHLLLRTGPCLQSCCLATLRSNPLQYVIVSWGIMDNPHWAV